MYDCIPLHYLAPGQCGCIDQLMGCPEEIQRLEELGLRCGCVVEMIQPGSPCIIRLEGSKLCFRDCDVFSVLVRPGAAV